MITVWVTALSGGWFHLFLLLFFYMRLYRKSNENKAVPKQQVPFFNGLYLKRV